MAAYSKELQEAACQMMDSRTQPLSTRDINRRSDGKVSTTTVLAIRDGKIVGPELLIEFARAADGDPNDLLTRAGYRYIRYVGDPTETSASVRRRHSEMRGFCAAVAGA